MALLKQSTAYTRSFKMISSSDHFSLKTGAAPVVNLSKAGAAFGAAGGTVTEIANGWYKIALSTTDTNTLGDLAYYITGTGADDTDFCDQISSVIESDLATPTNITAGTITTVTNLTNLPTIPANWLTAAGTAADFGTEVAAAVWQDAVAGDFTVASSIGKALYVTNIAPGGSGGHMISGSNAGTTTLGALTVTGITTLTGNVVLSDGLTVSAPSTLNRAGVTVTGNGTGAAMSLAAGATGKGIAITTTAGDGLSILPNAGHAIVATGNGTSKHGMLITGGTAGTSDGASFVAGTGGVDLRAAITGNVTGNLSGSVGSVTGLIAANLDVAVSTRMATYTQPTGFLAATFPATVASTTNITAGTITTTTNLTNLPTIPANWLTAAGMAADASLEIADAVWDEAIAGHLSAGSTGAALNAAGSAGDPWITALPGAYAAGSAGFIVGTNLDAQVSTRLASADVSVSGGVISADIRKVNGTTVNGSGTAGTPWGP